MRACGGREVRGGGGLVVRAGGRERADGLAVKLDSERLPAAIQVAALCGQQAERVSHTCLKAAERLRNLTCSLQEGNLITLLRRRVQRGQPAVVGAHSHTARERPASTCGVGQVIRLKSADRREDTQSLVSSMEIHLISQASTSM